MGTVLKMVDPKTRLNVGLTAYAIILALNLFLLKIKIEQWPKQQKHLPLTVILGSRYYSEYWNQRGINSCKIIASLFNVLKLFSCLLVGASATVVTLVIYLKEIILMFLHVGPSATASSYFF